MSSYMRQPFTPGGKFVVSKPFRFAGKDYKAGDEFPWRQLSCSVRKLRQLYEGRNLNNNFLTEEELVVSTGGGGGVDETPCLATFDPEIHDIINPEKGEWYIVDEDGTRILRVLPKEAKRLRKAVEPVEINQEKVVKVEVDPEEIDEVVLADPEDDPEGDIEPDEE